MSVGKSAGKPNALISSANPSRRKCSMVRAWVAFACGLNAVLGLSLMSTAVTSRRPSSLASMRPQGPPPTMITSASDEGTESTALVECIATLSGWPDDFCKRHSLGIYAKLGAANRLERLLVARGLELQA